MIAMTSSPACFTMCMELNQSNTKFQFRGTLPAMAIVCLSICMDSTQSNTQFQFKVPSWRRPSVICQLRQGWPNPIHNSNSRVPSSDGPWLFVNEYGANPIQYNSPIGQSRRSQSNPIHNSNSKVLS